MLDYVCELGLDIVLWLLLLFAVLMAWDYVCLDAFLVFFVCDFNV